MVKYKTDYKEWSKYYDIIYEIMNPKDFSMYKSFLFDAKEVLEMGVGTGRIPIKLIEEGKNWTGVDNSEEMILACKEKIEPMQPLTRNIFLIREDMTKLDLRESTNSIFNKKFDVVIYPSHSIMSVGNENNQIKALCSGVKHLSDKGVLIFDLHNPNNYSNAKDYILLGSKAIKEQRYSLFGKSLVDFENKVHSNHQMLKTREKEIKLKSYEHFLYFEDVLRITEEVKIEIIDVFGSYNKSKFVENSEEMIFICKKL